MVCSQRCNASHRLRYLAGDRSAAIRKRVWCRCSYVGGEPELAACVRMNPLGRASRSRPLAPANSLIMPGLTPRCARMQIWEWPLVWEGLAASVGIALEAVDRPEDVEAARKAASIGGMTAPMLLDAAHTASHHLQMHQRAR